MVSGGASPARIFHRPGHRCDHFPAGGFYDGGSQGICGPSPDVPARPPGTRLIYNLHAGCRVRCETSGLGRHPGRPGRGFLLFEVEFFAIAHHQHRLAILERAPEDRLRERIFEKMFDGPAQRARTVFLVVALLDEQQLRFRREFKGDLLLGDPLPNLRHFEVDDLEQVLLAQRPEEDDVRNPVDELRLEDLFGLVEHFFPHRLDVVEIVPAAGGEAHGRLTLELLRADIGGHDDDRVPEVDRATQRIGQPAVLENLQQQLDHVRMGLLDLVKQDDRIGPPAHLLGELAALFVPDVSRRRADQPRHGELLHVLGHVELDDRVLAGEHLRRQLLRELGLAHAGRPDKQERADRAARVLEVRARTAQRPRRWRPWRHPGR